MDAALLEIESVLRSQHRLRPGKENDFRILDRSQFLTARSEANETLGFLLAGIAAISLLVGGIGIMNIMLVSVTERTREIGIRKAMGATRRTVMLQFLTGALALSTLGGVIGIVIASILLWTQIEYGWLKITPSLAYPVELRWINVGIVLSTILILGWIASKIASSRVNRRLLVQ